MTNGYKHSNLFNEWNMKILDQDEVMMYSMLQACTTFYGMMDKKLVSWTNIIHGPETIDMQSLLY